jgi:hypothetical protein
MRTKHLGIFLNRRKPFLIYDAAQNFPIFIYQCRVMYCAPLLTRIVNMQSNHPHTSHTYIILRVLIQTLKFLVFTLEIVCNEKQGGSGRWHTFAVGLEPWWSRFIHWFSSYMIRRLNGFCNIGNIYLKEISTWEEHSSWTIIVTKLTLEIISIKTFVRFLKSSPCSCMPTK